MPYAGALSHPMVASELSAQYHLSLPVFNLLLAAVAGASLIVFSLSIHAL